MGYDAVRGINTYGHGCMPGAERQFAWWQSRYQAGSLGCYNPASKAGGRPSLHAEGRAMDIALDANDPAQRARGDAIFARVVANPEQFGAQEMLWRGYLWSWKNRSLGKRGPGHQQAEHMNHVHLGIDVAAAKTWTEAWLPHAQPPEKDDSMRIVIVDTDNANDVRNYVLSDRGISYVFIGAHVGYGIRRDAKAWIDCGVPYKVVKPTVAEQLVTAPTP